MTYISSYNPVEARLVLSIKIMNQNKHFFSPFLSQLYLQHLSQLQLSPPVPALLMSPGPAPLTLVPTNSAPVDSSFTSSQCPAQARAHRSWGSSSQCMWQGVYWTPLFPPAGCFFTTVRVQLSCSWWHTSSSQEFEGYVPGCWCLSALWEVQQDPLN